MSFFRKTVSAVTLSICLMLVFHSHASAFSLFHANESKGETGVLKNKLVAVEEKIPEDRIYLMFDKPFYYPGETLWFQAYVRNGADMLPSKMSGILHVEWIGPAGNKVKQLSLIIRKGTASGDISLDEDIPGGLYKIKAYTEWQKNSPDPAFFEKDIPVQRVILPALKMKIDFFREAYGKGDDVTLSLKVDTRQNKPYSGQAFTADLLLAGKESARTKGVTNRDGSALVKFKLPENLKTADGLVIVKFPYEGKTESISRAVPILLSKLDMGLYPEGGDMIAGLSCRVAVKVLNEFGKPADIAAVVKDSKGRIVSTFETLHKGMGFFRLTPIQSEKYTVHVTRPKGIEASFPVPESLDRGYSIEVDGHNGKSVSVFIKSTENETMTLVARSRGGVFSAKTYSVSKGESKVVLDTTNFPTGVCQITLFDSRNIERAERLFFLENGKRMNVSVTSDKEKYLPREKVTMTVHAADERGVPLPAQLSLAVADDSLITFADDKSGNILSKLLLEPDLKGRVYEPSYYFENADKKRNLALDLLMMTQGWRRFTWKALLSENPPAISFPAETALLKGVVLSGTHNPTPVAGAKVTVESTGKSVITDETGSFVFPDLDLYAVETLIASKGDQTGSPVSVRDYKNAVTLYLTPRYYEAGAGRPMMMKKNGRGLDMAVKDEMPMALAMERPVPAPAPKEAKPPVIEAKKERAGMFQEIMDPRFAGRMRRNILPENVNPPVYYRARVFPSMVYQTTETPERVDFRSTLCFKGLVETDHRGTAKVEFYNSDAVCSFRTTVEGIGQGGLIGRTEYRHHTQLPFSLSAKIPLELSMGDEAVIPVTLVNNTPKDMDGKLDITVPDGLQISGDASRTVRVEKNGTKVVPLTFKVLDKPGKAALKTVFTCGSDKDSLVSDLRIVPRGFPVKIGLSSDKADSSYDLVIAKPVPGSIKASFSAYPTILSDLLKGIESILQEPYGCFEQASSSTYPNIMVMNYLSGHKDPDPAVLKKAGDLIGKGYKRLVSFETREKGYEWFGENPGHEALTAYGLMEFNDMEKVYSGVDKDMVKRTAEWLLSRRDGEGGFSRNVKALDSFGRADSAITNAYIVYALSEAGYVYEIKKELEKAVTTALGSDDPYQLALTANALFNVKDPRKDTVLKKLLGHQAANGSFTGKTTSVTCSTGKALAVETTALTVLAILKSDTREAKILDSAVRFIITSRSSYGGFGNTQSTVLALKALSAFASYSRRTAESGTIAIDVNGKTVGEIAYKAGEQGEIIIPESQLSPSFNEGSYTVRVRYIGVSNPLPYTLSLNYNTLQPLSSKECALDLKTTMEKDQAKAGDTVRLAVTLANVKKDKGLPMTIALIGIPGGLSLQPWQIKDIQEKKQADYLEVIGNTLAIYYRQMKPGETRTVNLDLKAEVPGTYEAQASSAYLYYTAEHKAWIKGEAVKVTE